MDALGIAEGSVVAELGAGGGWFTLRLARRVGPNGLVYAEDIQPQMIEAIGRVQSENLTNVRPVLGTPSDPHLPPGLDAALISDAFHEMDDPEDPTLVVTLLRNVARSLKPQGGSASSTGRRVAAGPARGGSARRSEGGDRGRARRGSAADLAGGLPAVRVSAGVRTGG